VPFLSTNRQLAAKNRFSRRLFLGQKKGVVVHAGKMNIYFKKASFTQLWGPFAAKCGAFWCKMTCVLPLNATRFGAKRSAFWCKTQGKMVLNAGQNGTKRKVKGIKIHCYGINKTLSNHEKHG